MPRFTSEAAKQEWLAKCRATRAANRKDKGGKATVSPAAVRNGSGSAIDAAIEEIESKIAVLQTVKNQLLHAQSLL